MTLSPYGAQQPRGLALPGQYGQPVYGQQVQHLDRPADVDSWTSVLAATAQLAEQICNTDFVPAAMRNNPAACTAAMLTGRELGIGPMTSLAHIHIVKGKPGQSAQLMRQLVLAAGHQIRYVETNDSRCVVEGRRRGEDQWERVSFTAQQAKAANISLTGGYTAEDKLVARATSRLCRRKFADCLGGMAYTVEELEDGVGDAGTAASSDAPAPIVAAKRTAQRRGASRPPARRATRPATSAPPEPSGPPLPGEDNYETTTEPDHDEPPADGQPDQPSQAQNRKMHALFHDADVDQRDQRLQLTSIILGRTITTSTELSKADANTIIEHLDRWAAEGHLVDHAAAVLAGSEDQP